MFNTSKIQFFSSSMSPLDRCQLECSRRGRRHFWTLRAHTMHGTLWDPHPLWCTIVLRMQKMKRTFSKKVTRKMTAISVKHPQVWCCLLMTVTDNGYWHEYVLIHIAPFKFKYTSCKSVMQRTTILSLLLGFIFPHTISISVNTNQHFCIRFKLKATLVTRLLLWNICCNALPSLIYLQGSHANVSGCTRPKTHFIYYMMVYFRMSKGTLNGCCEK